MLTIHRLDLAENLAAYGEAEVSARIPSMSEVEYKRVCEIGFQHAIKRMPLMKAACLAAVEVVEGKPRELRRKHRIWRGIVRSTRSANPIHDAVTRQFQRYGAGRPVKTAEVLDHVSKVVGANLKGFSWIKSRKRFCSPFADGISYIGIDYTRCLFSMSFGVRHERIERALENLFPEKKSKLHPNRMTIWKWSINMGPFSPRWKYPTETTWPITGSDGLALATPEIVAFLKDVAEPYALRHRDPSAIRNTLLFLPGRVDDAFSDVCTIFAVDHLAQRRDWLDEDFERLRERFSALATQSEKGIPSIPEPALGFVIAIPKIQVLVPWADQLKRTYERVVERWNG
jgi:hypothetical protein